MRLKPYPEYKDSGLPWLGEIPAHWPVARLKHLVNNVVDQTTAKHANEMYIALEHIESWTGRIRPSIDDVEFDSTVKRFEPDDVLFGKLRPYLAKVARPSRSGVCVGEFFVLRAAPIDIASEFLERLLRSAPFIALINSSTFGAKMPRADWSFVGGVEIAYPPRREQEGIVRFLDHLDQLVNRLIRAKQRLIELLNEQKQAIIHRAVTRGLDPDAPMKPTGLDWLPEVPEHWKTTRLGTILEHIEQGWSPVASNDEDSEDRWSVITLSAVKGGIFDPSARKTLPLDMQPAHRLEIRPGDFLLSRANTQSLVGDVAIVRACRSKLILSDLVYRLHLRKNIIYPEFLKSFLLSRAGRSQIERDARGSNQTMVKISHGLIRAWHLPLPPLEEQIEIDQHINDQFGPLTQAIDRARREIVLIREYRTRLISDIVTGKLDVRGVEMPETEGAGDQLGVDRVPHPTPDTALGELSDVP